MLPKEKEFIPTMNVQELLSHHGIRFERKENNNIYIECPECGKMNLSINVFSGIWHCWNSDCQERGYRGNFPSLAEILSISAEGFTPGAQPPEPDRRLSDEDARAILSANSNKPEVIEWAASRGLDSSFVLAQGVGYDPHVRAIVFPFRDPKGNLIGAKYRGTDRPDQWIKGVQPALYILDPHDLKREKVVVVEGEVDALTLKAIGVPVVATLGAGKDQGLDLLSTHRQVYLGYDMDAAGETGAEKAAQKLGRYRCKRVEWRLKDPNDMLMAGASKEELLECIKNAKVLATDIKSKNAKDALHEYLQMLEKAPRKRLSWGYPKLDAFTHGIGGGMYIGVLAEAGTGKTTFIINSARNNAHAGVSVGIASLEEHAVNEITPKLMATIVGRNPGSGGFSPEEVKQAETIISRVHLFDGDAELEPLKDWIRECYYVHDCKVVFIDYLQLLMPDETNVQQVKETCYTFKKLVKEMPELCIVMIIQPKQKQRARAKDGSEAKTLKMEGSDARGGAAINQSVDAMLTIKMVENHPNMTQFEYTKVRGHLRVSKRDWLNQFTQLEYDHGTLRQVEVNHLIYGG